MSIMASIDMYFYKNYWNELSANELFCHLQTHGWTTDMDKKQEYLPINYNNMFDWQCQKINNDKLHYTIKQKSLNFEIIGVGMTWQNSNIGGHFLYQLNPKPHQTYATIFSMAYSVELKQKALDYLEECGNINQVATAFGVDLKHHSCLG